MEVPPGLAVFAAEDPAGAAALVEEAPPAGVAVLLVDSAADAATVNATPKVVKSENFMLVSKMLNTVNLPCAL